MFISTFSFCAADLSAHQLAETCGALSLIWIQLIGNQTVGYFRKGSACVATGQARANRYQPIVAAAHLPDGGLPSSARQVLVVKAHLVTCGDSAKSKPSL